MAQPGERSSAGALSGAFGGDSSTPEDAAGLLWTAMHCEDPVLFLIPKHMFWAERESAEPIRAIPLGKARKRTGWFGRDANCLGQHGGEIARGDRKNRKRSEHRAD